MEMIVVLLVVSPLALAVWLIIRALRAQNHIEELTRRMDDLQLDVARLKDSLAARKPSPETTKPVQPVTPPSPKPETVAVPPPVIIPPRPPEIIPPISPRPEPALAALPEKTSFEMQLGTFWLVRVGIVMLLAGLAFFANYAYHHIVGKLGAAGKISLLYLASGLLLGAGAWWQRRNAKATLKNYAQVLFAGGLAAVYFTTYAAHHVPPLRVIGSALLDGGLLLAWAGVIAWLADRHKSEIMAIFAIGLAFFTSVITRVGEFTLYSNLILTLAAVGFLVRNRWAALSFASLVTSYAGYAFWRFLRDDGWRWALPDENLWLGAIFLAGYWLVFTVATFWSRSEKLSGASRAAFLTLNNGAFFILFLLTMLQVRSGGFWKFSLGYGVTLLALALAAKKFLSAEPLAKNSYLTQGLLLVTLGFIAKFSGLQLALVLGAESVALFLLGSQRRSPVLKSFAALAAALASGWCVAGLKQFDAAGLWTGGGLGALLAFNAFWAHRQADEKNTALLRSEPAFFTFFACVSWLAATWINVTEEQLPLVLALEAVALTLSLHLLRVREITLLGQFFLILAQFIWLFYFHVVWLHFHTAALPWWNPLALIAITLGMSVWWARQKILPTGLARAYRWVAVAMSLLWVWDYAPERQQVWALMLLAALIFTLAWRRRNRETLAASAVYAAAALGALWLRADLKMDIYAPNLLALLALFAMQQILRRAGEKFPLDEKIHGAIIGLAGVSLWRFVSGWAAGFTGGFFITMIWAGLAVLIFTAGMILRERFYRWLGLGVLATAVGRVVLVDVWKQETIWRVLTFMALGAALLVIGFIYNKYQDAIRKWL